MTQRPLIRFDTSLIPTNSQVKSAELYLYLDTYVHSPSVSPRVSVYKVKRDWVVSEATWDLAKSGEAWEVSGCDGANDRNVTESGATVVSANDAWYNWDITSLVSDWVANPAGNRGMILVSDAGRELRFYSADDPDTRRIPYLTVEYIERGGTPTTPTPTVSPTNTPSVEPSPQITEKGASQDTYIDYYNQSTNYEARYLHVYGLGYKRALLNFDVSDLPAGAQIVSATLRLTADFQCNLNQDRPLAVGVYQVNKSWVARQATWNVAAVGMPWAMAGCEGVPLDRNATPANITTVTEVSGSHPWEVKNYIWDVTSIVQSWVDSPSTQAGLLLMTQDAIFRDICFPDSSYSLADRRPLLHIAWRPAPPPTSTPTPTPTRTPDGSITPTPTPTSSLGAIEGTVFEDMNVNGRRDAGEPGLGGVTVELWQGGTRISQQSTVGSGAYRFADLTPGTYIVKETDPPGYRSSPSSPNELSGVVVMAGRTTSGIDFADYDPRVVTPPSFVYLPIILKK
jgi:hypothetical protein